MKKVFAEIGFGNATFLSTEFEEEESERRVRGFFLPEKIRDYYFRLWFLKRVFILSSGDGFKVIKKDKNRLKILFGVGGESA